MFRFFIGTGLVGSASKDTLIGGDGDDTLYGGGMETAPNDMADTLLGGAGNDVLYGNGGNDLLLGQQGSDTVYGGLGDDSIYGGTGETDTADSGDVLYGHDGKDWIYGNGGADLLYGGDSTDTLFGGLGDDTIYGGNSYASVSDGNDWIAAGSGSDLVFGGAGNDSIFGGNGITDSTDGDDTIDGGDGDDILYGNAGADSLIGGNGDDTLYGGLGIDTLEGGEGRDVIVASAEDIVRGGAGIDRFVLDVSEALAPAAIRANGADATSVLTIKDLEVGEVIWLVNMGNTSTAAVALDAEGNTVITVDGKIVAQLESVAVTDVLSLGSNLAGNVNSGYVIGGTSGGNGGTGGSGVTLQAPQLTGLDNVTFLENAVNSSALVIDTAVTLTDVDSASFNGGNLTVRYHAGGTAEDSLSVRHQGSAAGQIGFNGTTVSYAGTAIGTVTTNGLNGANLVVTFNTNATLAAVDALLDNLTYHNNSNTPIVSRTISVTVNDGTLTSVPITSVITVTSQAEAAAAVVADELSTLTANDTTGWRIEGVTALDGLGRSVSYAGDVNGDGFGDVILGAHYGDPGGRSNAGQSYVIFGKADGWTTPFDHANLDGTSGFRLDGIAAGDESGRSVSAAGDVNGDGYDDLIIGAFQADPGGNSTSGESYVVFGKASGWAWQVDLSSLNGTTGFRFTGTAITDRSGRSVSGTGDVNGDGYEDIIIGADRADPNALNDSGAGYVIYGKAGGWAASAGLSTLNGANGFSLAGVAADDNAGGAVSFAGDMNGDGLEDILIASNAADPGGRTDAGETYVVFGSTAARPASINLSSLNGTTGFRLAGIAASDFSGRSISTAGDINGDGYDDIVIGSALADPGGRSNAGQAYVVFGKASAWAASTDLSSLDGTTGFRMDGILANDNAGRSVASAGDVNGDGYDDLIIGAYRGDPGGRNNAGETYIVYGKADGWAANMDLSSLDGTNGYRLNGLLAGDSTGYSATSAGDVNGDGFDDLLIGAFQADPGGRNNAGQSYIVFGNNNSAAATAVGTTGADTISGTANRDVIVAGLGDDVVSGYGGDDVIKGANGNDALYGNAGADRLYGGNGNDTLDGSDDSDFLYGGDGADILLGGAGGDHIWGENGNDTLNGGTGADTLIGGLGNDVFVFAAGDSTQARTDTVTLDFDQDKFQIAGAAADTINVVNGLTANLLGQVTAAYNGAGIDRIGDANYIHVTGGTLAGRDYVILSMDGNGTYNEGVDILMRVIGNGTFTVADIIST